MTYTYNDVPLNKIIWCCAYSTDSNKESMALKCLPRKCVVTSPCNSSSKKCTYIGKDNKPIKQSFYAESRQYADTYEECCSLFNDLVQERYDFLESLQKQVCKDFINI